MEIKLKELHRVLDVSPLKKKNYFEINDKCISNFFIFDFAE